MPLVEISLFPGRTLPQKLAIARQVSDALVEIGHAQPENVEVIFREVEPDEWFKYERLRKDTE